ncbi:MAG TPA: AAA family ATPase [Blastocatellia bacterium]|nr:AAA family ATPase [Blastocatellia bacterium]
MMNNFETPLSFKPTLADFTSDLTVAALRGQLEPVRCRDAEIERVVTTLLRQSKNNPVLIGEAGVGKTAVVEGLAQRIVAQQVPASLRNVRILALGHMDLIAGTSFRGQYEKRLKAVIDELSDDPTAILFIDELHNLVGAGTGIGQPMDAANMLKPALASGRLRVIGATTQEEHERYIQADAALERRFQPIVVKELGRAETLEVLQARRPRLALHHTLAITDEALAAAADLSGQHLPDRKQPDRSIDLLDETCARVRLRAEEPTQEIVSLKQRHAELAEEEREAINQVMMLAAAKGTPLERFSRGTFKVLEAMGLGLENVLTGHTTERDPMPPPPSVRRLQETDPAGRLAQLHQERLQVESELQARLLAQGPQVTAAEVSATLQT